MKHASLIALTFLPLLLLLTPGAAFASTPQSADIVRSGKAIRLDGFLLDWNEKNRRNWPGESGRWTWDAINTQEGVAGFFQGVMPSQGCASWTFYASARRLSEAPIAMATSPGKPASVDRRYAESIEQRDSSRVVTLEWLIPWDSVGVDSTGSYAIRIAAISSCGDTLPPFLATGSVNTMKSRLPFPPWFVPQLILIGCLLAVFVRLQFVIRKKSRRKGAPRRSA